MAYTKTIMCLANSRKISGRCIAGRELMDDQHGEWIRPVSSRKDREISEEERRYENGLRAGVGDIITINFLKPVPRDCHVEDHLIDDKYYWTKVGQLSWKTVNSLVEPTNEPLWIKPDSIYHGQNDQLTEEQSRDLGSSLKLIRPEDFWLTVQPETQYSGPSKRVVRVDFRVAGCRHVLKVTDPYVEASCLQREDGSYDFSNAILCVSLSEPWKNHVYFLAAAVLTSDRFK